MISGEIEFKILTVESEIKELQRLKKEKGIQLRLYNKYIVSLRSKRRNLYIDFFNCNRQIR